MNINGLVSWLRFDSAATADKCGETWTAYGSPTISNNALQLNGSSYLKRDSPFKFTGQPFSIGCWFSGTSNTTGGSTCIWQLHINNNTRIQLDLATNGKLSLWKDSDSTVYILTSASVLDGQMHYAECAYANSTWYLFLDGQRIGTANHTPNNKTYTLYLGTNYVMNRKFTGTIEEFQIYDGVALHTENFTPPTDEDYTQLALELDGQAPLTLQIDVERTVRNTIAVSFTTDVERQLKTKWRYVNMGDVHDLTQTPTYLTDLPATKSTTGSAFYQTAMDKCFDLSATNEIWIKFDVYFDGSNRWRAYNGGSNGVTGITAQTDGRLHFFSNGTNVTPDANNNFSVLNDEQLQTVLLHMISGSSAGIIEAWVDGTKIYTYTGDVNHGDDFADIYLQSDGSGTVFSNVIISNAEIGLSDGWQKITVDAERRIQSSYQINTDVERTIIAPIVVPLIGEHFNHFVPSAEFFFNRPRRIILPKASKAYVRGVGVGSIKVFSDTDASGVITGNEAFEQGNMYAELEECETVFIEGTSTTATAQSIIRALISSLCKTTQENGTYALNEAINYATNGKFPTRNDISASLLSDVDNSTSYAEFLQDKCGIILDNEDTGAITGWDASGNSIKTATSVVPEQIPAEDWTVPEGGSVVEISGLTVHFPSAGANGSLTATEKHILAGLNSAWIRASLQLIKESLGIDFNGANLTFTDIYVRFVSDASDYNLAYIQKRETSLRLTTVSLIINMYYYRYIDTTSDDGTLIPVSEMYYSAGYLDRTLAHELTHAVMMANINVFDSLPPFFKEGMAELVHGIDDLRRDSIVALVSTDKINLRGLYTTSRTETIENDYAGGYLFLRYLAKQNIVIAPPTMEVANLLISDGATTSSYNALTDNTRQLFNPNVLRTLIKTISPASDVEIRDVIPAEVVTDVRRAFITKISIRPISNNQLTENDNISQNTLNTLQTPKFSLRSPKRSAGNWVLPDMPNTGNSAYIQKIELSFSEQQLTESVRITATEKFNEYLGVGYLDYRNGLVVNRVRYQNGLYTHECSLDYEDLFYTQLTLLGKTATTKEEFEESLTGGAVSEELDYDYLPASQVVAAIATAMDLKYEKKKNDDGSLTNEPKFDFDDFTPSMKFSAKRDKKGKVTEFYCERGAVSYADLIRELFGWTARVPHHMINVMISNGMEGAQLFVVERGQEKYVADLDQWGRYEVQGGDEVVTPPIPDELIEQPRRFKEHSSNLIITEERVRTTWGSTPWSNTVIDEWETYSFDDEDEDDTVREVQTEFKGIDYQGYTIYTYNKAGLLIQTYTYIHKDIGVFGQETHTTVNHSYDDDGTMIYTESFTQSFGQNGESASKSIEEKGYVILPNGEKFLAWEKSEIYQNYKGLSISDSDLVDSKMTTHSPSRVGQRHTISISRDGEVDGSSIGQNTGDDRVTPYATATSKALSQKKTTTHSEQRTLSGMLLYDSSFPLHEEGDLINVTANLKELNGALKVTVQITIYEFPHVITFLDKVRLQGKDYFLVSNVVTSTPRTGSSQNLTLVRYDT